MNEIALVSALVQLDVPFLASADIDEPADPISPTALLCGLAQSDAARVRLALIPLFLKRPELAAFVAEADAELTDDAQTTLRCYYTAAHFLQHKYHAELTLLFPKIEYLPPLFFPELHHTSHPIQHLHDIHSNRTAQPINWSGTYHHAFQQWIRHERKRLRWSNH